MQDNLTIEVLIQNNIAAVTLTGRLDASWAGHLDENLDKLIRAGTYDVHLNTLGITYISSAGIRILVKQYKNLHAVNGSLVITDFSDQVREVLDMVGMVDMFSLKKEAKKNVDKAEDTTHTDKGYRFTVLKTESADPMEISITGSPKKLSAGNYNADDNTLLRFSGNSYAIGIGAMGQNFNDCQNRYGEFISLGDAVAYLPSDNSATPDYTFRSGKLIPEINALYSINADGKFNKLTKFETEGDIKQIALSDIITNLFQNNSEEIMSFLMIAESGGLVGSSLNVSPVKNLDPFNFPEVRDRIQFTTEPAHIKMLTVSFGIVARNPNKEIAAFLRALTPGSDLSVHIHTAVFPYHPLKKRDIKMNETIKTLFEESELIDILHLTNDYRDIQGLGESQFTHGFCWSNSCKQTSSK